MKDIRPQNIIRVSYSQFTGFFSYYFTRVSQRINTADKRSLYSVRGGGLRCWGLCAFVIKCLRRLWVFIVVVRLDGKGKGKGKVFPLHVRCGPESG